MRPVDKGEKPAKKFRKYSEATPVLEERIGSYCSYCEYPIKHVPEVDHIVSKSKGGKLLDWDNFLLACKYCNTRKKAVVDENNEANFLWPDEYNSFMAYTYENGIPKVNRNILSNAGKDIVEKAESLFELVKLNYIPNGKEKDKRFVNRCEAIKYATDSREAWERFSKVIETSEIKELKEAWLEQTINLAKEIGFFSVWMEAFQDIPLIRKRLIDVFVGTNRKCFDDNGNAVWWCKEDDS